MKKTDGLKFIHREVPGYIVISLYILLALCTIIFITGIVFLKKESDRLNFSGIYNGEKEIPCDIYIKSYFMFRV